jgi:hypothetical protein
MKCVVVVSVIGVQGQPERVLKECEVVVGLVRELQRATVVRECGLKERQEAQRGTIQQGRFVVVEGGVSNGDTLDTRRDLTLSKPLLIEDAIPARCHGPSRRLDMSQSTSRLA